MFHSTLKKFAIAAIILLVAGIGVQLTKTSYVGLAEKRIPAFPDLYSKIEEVTHINIKNRLFNFNLLKEGNSWVVKELSGYPADMRRVNALLKEMALMQLLEEKKFNPETFIAMRVLEENSNGEIKLFDEKEKKLAGVIVGNRKIGISGIVLGTYIRRFGETNAFLSDTELDATGSALNWTDTSILDIDASHIASINSEQKVSKIGTGFQTFLSGLSFINVVREQDYTDKLSHINTVTFVLHNRLEIIVKAFRGKDDDYFISITPNLEGNVVRKDADAVFKYIEARHKGWLYKIPKLRFVPLMPVS